MKTTIQLLLALLLLTGFAACRKKGETPLGSVIPPEILKDTTEMVFDSVTYDFGKIKQGDKVTHIFHFKNTGQHNLIIARAYGSCGCTVPEYPKDPVPPGQAGEIKVTFNSAGKSGKQDKTVFMLCNTALRNETLHITGEVITE